MLAFAWLRQQHYLSVGELQGIVMSIEPVFVDLPERSHLVPQLALRAEYGASFTRYFLFEAKLRAGKQTYGYVALFERSETTRNRVREPC